MATAYQLYGVKQSTTEIGGIVSQRVSNNIAALQQGGGGQVDPTFTAIMGWEPVLSFTTVHIAEALAAFGIDGTDATDLDLGFQKVAANGTRSANYLRLRIYEGIIVPTRLSASHKAEATIEYTIYCAGDATHSPYAVSTDALSFSQGCSEKFTAGPVDINGTDYETQGFDIDFGINVSSIGHSGLAWPTACYIAERKPRISINLLDAGKLATFQASTAGGLTVTSCTAFLRKLAAGGGVRVADATEEHISILCTEALAYAEELSGDHAAEAALSLTVLPAYDGTNAIFQIDTTAAIS